MEKYDSVERAVELCGYRKYIILYRDYKDDVLIFQSIFGFYSITLLRTNVDADFDAIKYF